MTRDAQTWDLERLYAGGVEGEAFTAALATLGQALHALQRRCDALGEPGQDAAWDEVIPALSRAEEELQGLWTFASCHAAAASDSAVAARAEVQVAALVGVVQRAWTVPHQRLARCAPAAWEALRARPALAGVQVSLEEGRAQAPVLLPEAEQSLYDELAEDALHGWGQLYRQVTGRLRVDLDGEALSLSQARNRLDHPDQQRRRAVFDATERAWESVQDTCGTALSRIVGLRATHAARLGVDELEPALVRQRIHRTTLEALRAACWEGRALVDRYLRARARLAGLESQHCYDLLAPVGSASTRLDWPAAKALVIEQVGTFSADMRGLFQRALDQRWVEAEDRAGKRAGAFCAWAPALGESRVFMTYGGGLDSVRTLAHELGHAYHNHVLRDLPRGQKQLTSCLAETASTFAETVVRQALLDRAPDAAARIALLDRELADATGMLCNIMVRFDLERALFELRARGPLDPARLSDRCEALHRAWYGPALERQDRMLWASKLHFYLTRQPFYNFPYTFGYLFSSMVYQRARDEGPAWADTWRALLVDTRRGPAEALAARYLGVDLTRVDTWLAPIARLEPLVAELEAAAA